VTTRVEFDSLNRRRLENLYFHLDTGKQAGKGYRFGLYRRNGKGPFHTRFYRVTEFTSHYVETERRRCRGIGFDFGKDHVHITLPQRCRRAAGGGFRFRVEADPRHTKRWEYDYAPDWFSRWVRRG